MDGDLGSGTRERNDDMEINGEVVSDIYYYQDMDLSDATRKALDKRGFTQATAIQGGAIPASWSGRTW